MDFSQAPRKFLKALYHSLKGVMNEEIELRDISSAWEKAALYSEQKIRDWKDEFTREFRPGRDLSVVLLGRPYVILSGELNKNIPEYFSIRGIKCFF